MGLFDDYDILGGLGDLASTPFKAADKLLFGGPGEVGGIIGTPIKAVLENPTEAAAVVATATITGGAALAATPVICGIAGAVGATSSALPMVTAGSVGIGAKSLFGATFSEYVAAAAVVESKTIAVRHLALYQAAGFVTKGITDHLVDNYIRETVHPVEGCVIYCDLGLVVEHSGVYVGNGRVVHLDGSGAVELVTQEKFIRRLGGVNPALSIYVSCCGTRAIGDEITAQRALAMMGRQRNYSVLLDNCHQFTSGCITGNSENSDNFWSTLKNTVESHYGADSWRVWRSGS